MAQLFQKSINANPRLKINSQMLVSADIWQNFTSEEVHVNLEKQKKSKQNFHQKVENGKQELTLILN